jgi:hypothetical protein
MNTDVVGEATDELWTISLMPTEWSEETFTQGSRFAPTLG